MAQNLISINSDLRKDSDEDHAFRKRQQKQYPGLYKEAYQIIYQKSCPEVSTDSCQKKNFQVSQKPYPKLPCQETLQSQAPKLSEQPYQEIDLESKQNPFAKLCEEPYQIEYKVLHQKSSTDELSSKVSRQSLLNAQPKLSKEPYQEWSVDSYSELSPEKYQKLYYEKIQKSYVVERHDQCPKLCQEDYISPCSEDHQSPYQELSEKSHPQKYKEVLLPEESDIWKYQELCEHMVSAEALAREQSPDVSKELSHKTFPKFQYSDCLQNTEFSIKLNQEVTIPPNAIDRPIKILPPSRRLAGMGYGNISQKRTCSNVPRNMTAQTSRTPCGMCDISSQTCERVSNYSRSPSHAPGPRPPIKSRRPPADIRYHEPYPSARRPGQSQGSRSIQRNETNWESYEVDADQVNQSINNSDRNRANTCRMCCESNDGKSSQCCGKSKCAKPPPKPFCEPCGSTKENFWESNNPPPETYRKTKGEPQIRSKSCPPPKPVDQSCPICATPDYSSYSKSYGAGPSQQSAFQSPRNSANPNYRDSTKANLQLCPHCEKLFEQRAVPSLYREDSCESDYASTKLDPRGKYRSQKQCEPTESTDSHICRNPSCSKALKKPSTYGYRPCQAPQFPETQFTVNESKVDYMELQSGSGRFYKNPLTVSSCSCNIKERFIPESRRNSEPPRPHCDYSRSRSEEMHGRNHGLPPLNNNACGANFVPVNYFQEKSTSKRKQRFSSGLAPRVSNITQRTGAQSANSSFAHVTPESSLHLAKRRYKLYNRRLSGCGATMTTKKFLQLSMKSRLFCPSKLHTKLMPSHQSIFTLSSQRMPIAKPCTVRVPSKALRLSECLCQKCRQRCRGGKLTANTNSLHSNRNTRISRPKVQTPSAVQRSNQASGSRPNRTQSTTVKREKVSIQTQTHSRSSRLRDQATIRAKLRLDLPTRYQLLSQNQQNSRSTSRALTRNTSVLGRERIDRAAAQKRQQQQQQSRVAERLPKRETERRQELVQEHERRQDQESEGRLNQYQTENKNTKSSNLTPQPQQLPNDPVRVMPPSHMRSHDSAGCIGTNIHHFYRGSFLSIRPTLPSDDTQVASGSRQRQSLLHVAESILRTDFMQPPKPRGSSFIVQNKWQYIPNFNGFAGAMAIQNLKSTNESRHINKNGGWLRSFRKLLPNWLFNSKIKATSA